MAETRLNPVLEAKKKKKNTVTLKTYPSYLSHPLHTFLVELQRTFFITICTVQLNSKMGLF